MVLHLLVASLGVLELDNCQFLLCALQFFDLGFMIGHVGFELSQNLS